MGSNDWNKGFFSSGPQSSPDAQAGQAARQQQDQQREAARRQAANPQNSWRPSDPIASGNTHYGAGSSGSSEPATFQGTLKGFAIAGLLSAVCYAYFYMHLAVGGSMALLAAEGAAAGAVCGVVMYGVIVVLRVVFAVLAVVLKFAFYAALVVGGIYLLGQYFV